MSLSSSRYAIVVGAGEVSDVGQLRRSAIGSNLIIAADGGLRWLDMAGVVPHIVIGDMDSVSSDDGRALTSTKFAIMTFPTDKDATDLQLAIDECTRRNFSEILAFGTLGGRIDHTFMNLSLLPYALAQGQRIIYIDGPLTITLVPPELVIEGQPGDIVSLLPFDALVSGVYTTGLRYPLNGSVLLRGGIPSGISNVLVESKATIRVELGNLLVMVTGCGPHMTRLNDRL